MLEGSKRLVGILKLGVPSSFKLEDFVDNLNDQTENYCFHHRNSKYHKDLEEAILHRVLTEESLSAQYIAEKETESIVWNQVLLRKYLESVRQADRKLSTSCASWFWNACQRYRAFNLPDSEW